MYFISLFIVYGNFILFFALIFCTVFEWNIFLYGIFMKKCSIFLQLPYLALPSSSHPFPPFLFQDVKLPALLQLQDCICHRSPVRRV